MSAQRNNRLVAMFGNTYLRYEWMYKLCVGCSIYFIFNPLLALFFLYSKGSKVCQIFYYLSGFHSPFLQLILLENFVSSHVLRLLFYYINGNSHISWMLMKLCWKRLRDFDLTDLSMMYLWILKGYVLDCYLSFWYQEKWTSVLIIFLWLIWV